MSVPVEHVHLSCADARPYCVEGGAVWGDRTVARSEDQVDPLGPYSEGRRCRLGVDGTKLGDDRATLLGIADRAITTVTASLPYR
jgi:hypothetical protein